MRTHSRLLAVATAAVVVTACGGSDSNAPDNSHVGTYELALIDGAPLPASILSVPGYRLDVTDGELTLLANNTFVESITIVEYTDDVQGPIEATSCVGSYRRTGSTITFTLPAGPICDAGTVTGRIEGRNTLVVDFDGLEAVYRR